MGADTVLVIDDDKERGGLLARLLEFVGYGQVAATDSAAWQDAVAADRVKTVFLGEPESDSGALKEVEAIRAWAPHAPLLLVGEGEEASLPQEAIGRLTPPFFYPELLEHLYRADVYRAGTLLRVESRELARVLVGKSAAIHEVRRLIAQVAPSDANVLILGESGTGKELVAQGVHYLSNRRQKPFVPVNCGAIPGELLESELFGHEKGAFTGAISTRQGRFELAEGGSLFLDEIGDMPLPMQVKLLRVLQERCFERVGSAKSLSTDVRVVAATHRQLEEHIAEGSFREDLYYRLNVFPIELPPLRERADDVPLLIREFIHRMERESRGSVRLTAGALGSLRAYPWPGNVRELANLMERLVIMFPGGVVDVRDLPEKYQMEGAQPVEDLPSAPEPPARSANETPAGDPLRLPSEGLDLKAHLADQERALINQALDQAGGVVAHAAKLLKMRRTTLVEKMRKYDIQR